MQKRCEEPSDCSLITQWALRAQRTRRSARKRGSTQQRTARGVGIGLIPTSGPGSAVDQPFSVPPV